jgi:hypothetical protein
MASRAVQRATGNVGRASLRCRLDMEAERGRPTSIATALHAIHATPAACRASRGIETRPDLPLLGGGFIAAAASAE